ncbi:MAG: endonuclease [Deltaproteobacteria bacterium]|nr:endonuclease [Deltaproteobacteria bacterium]
MRLLLYNIRYGTGAGSRFHFPLPFSGYLKETSHNLHQIGGFIKSIRPDIIGLLEVDSGSYRTRRKSQAALIARELGHYYVYQSKYAATSVVGRLPVLSKQGNAFLTSRKIASSKFHYFREGIKRLVIELELEDVAILLVHLSLKYRHRQYQLHDLYELINRLDKPAIIAGDFNPFWGDRELELFLAATGLQNANLQGIPSHPSRAPRRQLDFILHNPEIRITDFQIPQVHYSDHMPLVCDFELISKRHNAVA